jgi:hypothetical protein
LIFVCLSACRTEDKKEISVWTYVWRNIQLLFIDTHMHTLVHRCRRRQYDHERGLYKYKYIYIYIHIGKKREHFERIDRIMLCNQHYSNVTLTTYRENQSQHVYIYIYAFYSSCLYQFLCRINNSWLIVLVFFEENVSLLTYGKLLSLS